MDNSNTHQVSTVTRLMRSDGEGLVGTYRNANHHAEALLLFVKILEPQANTFGFAEWVQGHNVHEFRTVDGRRFTLRGYTRDGEYKGLRLSLRLSRSNEVFLMDIESVEGLDVLIPTLRKLAQPMLGNKTPLLKDSATKPVQAAADTQAPDAAPVVTH